MARYWAGIDYSENLNDVAAVDANGTVVAHIRVEETPSGVGEVLALLRGLSASHRHSRRQVPIGIETTQGLLVAGLLSAGQPVVPLNPTMVARYRGRLSPGRKADRTDAALLANILRTDGTLLRSLPDNSPQALALTETVYAQYRAAREQRREVNQLRSVLRNYFPGAIHAWTGLPHQLLRPEARALLEVAPTPRKAARLSKRQIADTLVAAGRIRLVDDHAARLREVFAIPQLHQPPEVEEAMGHAMLATLARLNRAYDVTASITARTEELFRAHPNAPIYLSLPGCGALIGARLLAEIGDDLTRFETPKGLRAYAGAAPFTWASGGSRAVTSRRRAANLRLKGCGHVWAFAALTRSPGCRAYYDHRKLEGDSHAAALRKLCGRLLTMLHHCLHHDELYREDKAFPAREGARAPGAGAATPAA